MSTPGTTQKRQRWIQVCALFGTLWLVAGLFYAYPLLVLAVASYLMALLPVGMSDAPVPPDTRNERPWRRDEEGDEQRP